MKKICLILLSLILCLSLSSCSLIILPLFTETPDLGGMIDSIFGGDDDRDNAPVKWDTITVTTGDTQQGDLVIVNGTHEYKFPATTDFSEIWGKWSSHNPRIYQQSGLSKYMDTDALNALDAMLVDFNAATGKTDVQIRYAYRTYEEQQELGSSIAAGYSDHHTGLGVQLKYVIGTNAYALSTDESGTYNWFFENAHKYGFVVRYPADKTETTGVEDYGDYFRYVGVAHATYMYENNLCMEEYVEFLKDYTNKKPLKINKAADGKYYEVYYVAVDGSTNVDVPSNYNYVLSGTNEGGVVITVDHSSSISD